MELIKRVLYQSMSFSLLSKAYNLAYKVDCYYESIQSVRN